MHMRSEANEVWAALCTRERLWADSVMDCQGHCVVVRLLEDLKAAHAAQMTVLQEMGDDIAHIEAFLESQRQTQEQQNQQLRLLVLRRPMPTCRPRSRSRGRSSDESSSE